MGNLRSFKCRARRPINKSVSISGSMTEFSFDPYVEYMAHFDVRYPDLGALVEHPDFNHTLSMVVTESELLEDFYMEEVYVRY